MKPRFELDGGDAGASPSSRLIDPEAYDASEEQFAASIDLRPEPGKVSFVVEEVEAPVHNPQQQNAVNAEPAVISAPTESTEEVTADATPPPSDLPQDPPDWRNELAARVNNYRARRRPREPRYPSLQLKFEPYEPTWNSHSNAVEPPASPLITQQALALNPVPVAHADEMASSEPSAYVAPQTPASETTARIIEFPRPASTVWMPPPRPFDELAEPVFDRPRILEAPEITPLPPALGGILIESADEPVVERRPGFEIPLQSAPMSRRLAGVSIDAAIVTLALGLFSYIFFRVTTTIPSLQPAAGMTAILAGIFWVAYQYLLLVYTGTTPGLRLAKLRLSQFDGGLVPRKTRRWRVLASMLSGVSLGLGYAWCFLDEDELCWHDRITRTYMAPIK